MPGEETTTVVTHPDGTTITTTTSALAATGDRSYLDTIGATPMVRVERALPEEAKQARVLVKLEMQNPGGSVKDRIAKSMIEDAEANGTLKPGMTVVEYTRYPALAGLLSSSKHSD